VLAVATWNLENLFRPGEGAGPTDQDAYTTKLDSLAATINHLTPTCWGCRRSATQMR
jgi:hypothetical protein